MELADQRQPQWASQLGSQNWRPGITAEIHATTLNNISMVEDISESFFFS